MNYSEQQLTDAFNKVKNPRNDEGPIWHYLKQTEVKDLNLYKQAIHKYSGKDAQFDKDGWSNGGYLKVK